MALSMSSIRSQIAGITPTTMSLVLSTDTSETQNLPEKNIHLLSNTNTVTSTGASPTWIAGMCHPDPDGYSMDDFQAQGVTSDRSGNIHISGTYYFGSGFILNAGLNLSTYTIRYTAGGNQGFVIKYNSFGNLQWAGSIAGDPYGQWDMLGQCVSVDSTGNVIVSGTYGYYNTGITYTVYSAGNVASGITLRPNAVADTRRNTHITKYNSSGTAQWASVIINTGAKSCNTVDSGGNIYASGVYTNSSIIYNAGNVQSALTTISAFNQGYMVKFSTAGSALWLATSYVPYTNTCADSSSNVYACGPYGYTGTQTYSTYLGTSPSSVTLHPTAAGTGAVAMKWNTSGTAQWLVSVENTIATTITDQLALATDASLNLYMTGYINNKTGPGVIYNAGRVASTISIPASLRGDYAFIVKYNSSGVAQWVILIQGNCKIHPKGIAVDASGNITIGCSFAGEVTEYNRAANGAFPTSLGVFTIKNANGTSVKTYGGPPGDGAIFRFNSSGVFQWMSRSSDQLMNLSIDSSNNIIATGRSFWYNMPYLHYTNLYNWSGTNTALFATCHVTKYAVGAISIPRAYKIIPNANVDGMQKILLNTSATNTAIVELRNQADTATVDTMYIDPLTGADVILWGNHWIYSYFTVDRQYFYGV